ncbi:MAG: D-aminoacylase [Opitutae bacterium]
MMRRPGLLLLALVPLGVAAVDYDLVIRHGRVIDGTGRPAFASDVAVKDGRIALVGQVEGTGRQEIEAAGQVVAPGFIDVHTHSEDIAELPVAENFLRMGVTTIITGNCGSSKLDVAGFFAELEQTKVAVNVGTLIGHGTVRLEVLGSSIARPPTAAELERMRAIVDRGMQDGAVGLSTGLIYLPGVFAKTDEIVELAKVVAKHGGIYASHMRYENSRIIEALAEITQVAREAHLPIEVSHLKLGGPSAWGRAAEVLAYLDRARAEGLSITHDQYVYTASSTSLGSRIPEEALAGGLDSFRARLADPAAKAKIRSAMKAALERSQNADFEFAVIANFVPDPSLNGLSIPAVARRLRGSATLDDQIETILDVESRGGAAAIFHGMDEADLKKFLVHPLTMVASDSSPRKFGEAVPHPRGYGNNARVLARYVREMKLLTLEEAVRKMTSLPAHTFGLAGRGSLIPGNRADLVVFDPATVSDQSVYADPHHYAIGFSNVVVNGVPVIRQGELTGERPGAVVRRGK